MNLFCYFAVRWDSVKFTITTNVAFYLHDLGMPNVTSAQSVTVCVFHLRVFLYICSLVGFTLNSVQLQKTP